MIAPIANTSGPQTGGASQKPSAGAPIAPSMDKTIFMQLLVAQLKNQDPMSPTDSTQFITQLAQFQQLEQSVNSAQDISAMRQDLDKLAAVPSTSQS